MRPVLSLLFLFLLHAAAAQSLLVPYYSHGKWGYCDTAHRILVPPRLSSATLIYDPTGTALRDLLRYLPDSASADTAHRSSPFFRDGHVGLLGPQGRTVIPPVYDQLLPSGISGEYDALRDGKYGLIDEQGHTLVPVRYDEVKR